MLSSLKQFTSSWVAQLLLGLLVLSFAVWGVADIFTGFGSGAVATVGKTEVPVEKFAQRYDRYVQNLQLQLRTQINQQLAQQFGVPNQVLADLVSEATLDDTARTMGLGISDKELSRRITTDPNLIGPTGIYSEPALRQRVSQMGLTLDQFVVEQRADYLRRQIVDAFASGLDVPETYMRAVSEFQDEERSVEYVVVSGPVPGLIDEPTETQLTPYYTENASQWRAPEYRAIQYFTLSPTELARPQDVLDTDVSEYFEQNIARYTTPERRSIDQIIFDSAVEAEAAAGALSSGTSFEDIAGQQDLQPADTVFGTFSRAELLDEDLAEAAFALPAGGVSGVLEGRFGPVIIRISKIDPVVVQELSEVGDQIRTEIAARAAAGEIADIHISIEDARAGGSGLDDVSRQYGLEMVSLTAVDITGADDFGNPITDLPAADLITAAFESDMGLENDPLTPASSTYVWYRVTGVTPAHDRPLAEVREDVVAAWKSAERERLAQAQAEVVAERLETGETLSAVADDLRLAVMSAQALTRTTTPEGELTAAGVTSAFGGPEGHVAISPASTPLARVVLLVDDVTTPAFFSGAPDLEPAEQVLNGQISLELIRLYVAEVQNDLDVHLNQAALNQLFSNTPTPQRPTRNLPM